MYRTLLAVDEEMEAPEKLAHAVTDLPGSADEVEAVVLNVFKEFKVTGESAPISSKDFYDENPPQTVRAVQEYLIERDVEASVRREHGEPGREILEVADELDVDLIVMGGRDRTPAGKVLFGSVTQSVLLNSDRPVMVVDAG